MFVVLVVLLSLFIILFVTITIFIRAMDQKQFKRFCEKKVSRIAKRNSFLNITNLDIHNYDSNKIMVDQVIFGKKYIYLVTNLFLKGFISGEKNDNSWKYFNNIKKTKHYLKNLDNVAEENINDFAAILGIKGDPIVSICLVPNECDINVKNINENKKFIVNYRKFNKKIRTLEKEEIGALNSKEIYEQFKVIKAKNEEELRR